MSLLQKSQEYPSPLYKGNFRKHLEIDSFWCAAKAVKYRIISAAVPHKESVKTSPDVYERFLETEECMMMGASEHSILIKSNSKSEFELDV